MKSKQVDYCLLISFYLIPLPVLWIVIVKEQPIRIPIQSSKRPKESESTLRIRIHNTQLLTVYIELIANR